MKNKFSSQNFFQKPNHQICFSILMDSKFQKQLFQTKLLPKNEPMNLFFYPDYLSMVRFLEEVLAGKLVFNFYWPLVPQTSKSPVWDLYKEEARKGDPNFENFGISKSWFYHFKIYIHGSQNWFQISFKSKIEKLLAVLRFAS